MQRGKQGWERSVSHSRGVPRRCNAEWPPPLGLSHHPTPRALLVPSLMWQRVLEHPHVTFRVWRGAGDRNYLLSPVPTIPSAQCRDNTWDSPKERDPCEASPPLCQPRELPPPLHVPAVFRAQGFSHALGAQEDSFIPVKSIPSSQQHQGWCWGGRRAGVAWETPSFTHPAPNR